jgi:putative ABC transport system ATP-binding protein
MSALVKINGVHKYFTRGSERIDVLKGVTLDIPQGDFLALMGHPARARRRCSTCSAGSISRRRRDRSRRHEHRRAVGRQLSKWRSHHIGFVFQLYNLLPVLTAERNVDLPLLLTKLSKAERMKRVASP